MMTESHSRELSGPALIPRTRQSHPKWLFAGTVGGLAAVAVAILWWDSNRPEKAYQRGRQALQSGDRAASRRESQRLIATPGFESRGRLLSGLLLVREGRALDALPELELAAQSETTFVEALTAAAECYYMLARYAAVVHIARAALARDADALAARRWLAAAYYDLGVTVDAVAELKTVAAAAPGDSRSERLLGLIYKEHDRFAEAVEHYRESLRRQAEQPDRQSILVELAESLVKLSRYDEALATLQDCDPTATSLTLAAECSESLGRTDEAHERLREAADLDPDYVPARLAQGRLLLVAGHAAEAARVLEEAVRRAPQSSLAHFHLSQAYARLGEELNSAEQLRLFQESQRRERRYIDFRDIASQRPDDPEIRYRLGVLASQLDKPDAARMWFHAVLALEPAHPAALAALAEPDPSPDRP
jgi:tetratricopeptide (TPR) repeat protein